MVIEDFTLTQALLVAVGSLSASVVYLFFSMLAMYRDVKKDHKECEQSKLMLFERIIRIEERTGAERRTQA